MRAEGLSNPGLSQDEINFLDETAKSDYKDATIRLREGEYQYSLAKAIASFHLEMHFPDVKDIIRRLYGDDKANDLQFVRKVQTVLKKMEKSGIVRILPKSKPWELQKYSLSSFKFQDSDRSSVSFASDEERETLRNHLRLIVNTQKPTTTTVSRVRIVALVLSTIAFYSIVLWALFQPVVDVVVFIPALGISVVFSILLGETLTLEVHGR